MGLNQLGVLTVGTLVPKEGGHTLIHSNLLVIPPWSRKPPPLLAPQGHYIRAYPMQNAVNKANSGWVAANLISSNLVYAGNHRHGTAGHSRGRSRTPKAAEVQVFGKPMPIEGGR